ncbi:response regulator [Paenibacillus sp. HJGM_3]|uniref:response regulator n=1 Tax=Paenibacillus sp. HJGM_3 TaxID=3379816 RepID=UPI003859BCC3
MHVVIVEDEKEILAGMTEVMAELVDGLDHVHAFDNAEEAILHIQDHAPEVIITDIVLPHASGLELIERVVTKTYQPKTIIVSGYNHFEYAQQGIRLGVQDYILKPFDKQRFRSVVLGMIEAVREEDEARKHRDPAASELGAKALRDKFLHGLCLQTTALHEHVYHRLMFWSLEWLAATDYAVIAIDAAGHGRSRAEQEADLISFAIGNIVDDIIREFTPSVLFRNARNQWCLIAGAADTDRLTEEVAEKIALYNKTTVRIGISVPAGGVQSLATAYEQALQALQVCSLSKGRTKQYYAELHTRTSLHTGAKGQQTSPEHIAQAMLAADAATLTAAVEALLRELALRLRTPDLRELSRAGLEWLAELHASLASRVESSLHHVPLELWEALDRCDSFESLQACMSEYVVQLARKINSTTSHFIIEKAKQLIEKRYAEPITLQGIAETLSIHPVWLSQLFKRECGVNFVDYLADVRIEQAKRLLRDSELKIYEIVRAVGYQDLQHFGQIFKKKTGLSPKDYRMGIAHPFDR